MLQLKVLVVKLFAVNGFSPRAVARREITTLTHEGFYDAVESGALEM